MCLVRVAVGARMQRFETTRWSIVQTAAAGESSARAALEILCRTYRNPVLAYVRHHIRDVDSAEDLTQAFFLHFLERAGHAAADPARGRFRAYLLTAVKRFLIDQHESKLAVKRGGGIRFESVDALDAGDIAGAEDPEAMFERDWALAVLDAALVRLREEARAADKLALFDRLREFLIERPGDTDYARLAEALSLRRNTLAVAVHRLRQRLRELVRAEIRETTNCPEALQRELTELHSALSTRGEE